MWNFRWNRKKKKEVINPVPPPNGTLQYNEHKYSDVTAGKVSPESEQFGLYEPPPYVPPTDKEIIEGLEFQDNYEAAGLITHLKKQNMILKGKLTKLTKKYEASEADRKMYIQQLNHLHGHGETE